MLLDRLATEMHSFDVGESKGNGCTKASKDGEAWRENYHGETELR